MRRYEQNRSGEIKVRLIAAGTCLTLIFLIWACQQAYHSSKVESGEWKDIALFLCSSQILNADIDDWKEVEAWVNTSYLADSEELGRHCIPVPTTFSRDDIQHGDFDKITVSWEVESYTSNKVIYTRACAVTDLDGRKEQDWDSFKSCTWERFPYGWGTAVGEEFSVSGSRDEVFSDPSFFNHILRILQYLQYKDFPVFLK